MEDRPLTERLLTQLESAADENEKLHRKVEELEARLRIIQTQLQQERNRSSTLTWPLVTTHTGNDGNTIP